MKRLSSVTVFLLLLSMAVAGCGSPSGRGKLAVTVPIPDQLLHKGRVAVSVTSLLVKVTKEGVVYEQNAPVTGDRVVVNFDHLSAGPWEIEVSALDADGYAVYHGSGMGLVQIGEVAAAEIPMLLCPGNVTITVAIPQSVSMSYGDVQFVNPQLQPVICPLQFSGSTAVGSLEGLKSTTWMCYIGLFDQGGAVIATDQFAVDVYPGRTLQIQATPTDEGGLTISTTWELPPQTPTGLVAEQRPDGVVALSWDPNLRDSGGFLVYRSDTETGRKQLLTPWLIFDTTYDDTAALAGRTYWYWVQFMTVDGLGSELSAPQHVGAVEPSKFTPQVLVRRQGDSFWDLTFSAAPKDGLTITSGNITFPSNEVYTLSRASSDPLGLSQPKPGIYRYDVWFSDGSHEEFSIELTTDHFTSIVCPTIISPGSDEIIMTTVPLLEYQIDGTYDGAIAQFWGFDGSEATQQLGNPTSGQISAGFLKPGVNYQWHIETHRNASPFVTLCGKSGFSYFQVSANAQ